MLANDFDSSLRPRQGPATEPANQRAGGRAGFVQHRRRKAAQQAKDLSKRAAMNSFYVTTPIYYVNDVPHLGHAYTTIVADALARFHRMQGAETYFLTGTDEHGQKIEEAAKARGKSPIELADEVVERFRDTWKQLEIANDDFIRTTEERHKAIVHKLWKTIADNSATGGEPDIYLGSYDGWYCVSCEAFYPESQLENGQCPTHKTPATWVSEPSYFFRMSAYQEQLLAHIEANPGFIRPSSYRNEIISFVKSGLRDLSISRTSFNWGIPVPNHPEHVVYVWFDALTNYISALGDFSGERHQTFWPASCHLIGKDILRFHAVYWPCMLLAAGWPLPESIVCHGWWTVRGEKISKSMPATRVDPNQLASDIGADALRYFLLREVPLGLDGDFSYEALIGRYNADLANDLGNLLNRSLTMAGKFAAGKVPAASDAIAGQPIHSALAEVASECAELAASHLREYAPSRALEAIWRLIREANRYVDATSPWKLAKDPNNRAEVAHVIRSLLEASFWAARMVAPVMPGKAREILSQLGYSDQQADAALAVWPDPAKFNHELTVGTEVQRGTPVFPRIDDKRATELFNRWIPDDARSTAQAGGKTGADDESTQRPTIAFDEFMRADLRVATIKAAEPIANTAKLLKLAVDVGEPEHRTVVAGIAEAYDPDQLIGKQVIFLANLKPTRIRGVVSQGMILAAGDEQIIGLSGFDRPSLPAGTRVR